MTYAAKILADSIASGVRLTTLEVTFPRFILAEFNTHRMLSRNSASSRAIPVERRIEQVRTNPFVPEAFTKNKRGMQADEALDGDLGARALAVWQDACSNALKHAQLLSDIGVHKQHANRLLEPYCWHTVVVSATEWENFFALRDHHAAQPEMQITAHMMKEAMLASSPEELKPGQWHLPFISAQDRKNAEYMEREHPGTEWMRGMIKTSVVQCAAVSFLRQDEERGLGAIYKRHDEMVSMAHWSPFEHQAKYATSDDLYDEASDGLLIGTPSFVGNFRVPWLQYRKTFEGEAVFSPNGE